MILPFGIAKSARFGRQPLRLLCHPFLLILYGLSHLMPRDRNLWVFGLPNRFAWNSKYLFLYLANEKAHAVKFIWIARDRKLVEALRSRGYPATLWWSPRGIWSCLRSAYFIADAYVDTINFWLSGGAKEVLVWHGIPLKKLERDIENGESIEVMITQSRGLLRFIIWFLLPWRFRKPDYMVATSPAFQEIFANAFEVQKKNVFVAGFPKNDVLFGTIPGIDIGSDIRALAEVMSFKEKNPSGKVVLYVPTWRDTGGDSFFEKREELLFLDTFLREQKMLFLFKAHPATRKDVVGRLLEGGMVRNIILVDPQSDADSLLEKADVLVTDYSGIFFEFLLLDRPVIFFPFDYEKYVTKDRELYFPYEEITPGPKARTLPELLDALKGICDGKDEYAPLRKKVREFTYTHQDGKSAERVFSVLKDLCRKREKSFS